MSQMRKCLKSLTKDSKFIYQGSLSSSIRSKQSGNSNSRGGADSDFNLVVMPKYTTLRSDVDDLTKELFFVDFYKNEANTFDESATQFVNDILSLKSGSRSNASGNLFNASLTEKKWFTYANKMWDLIRKSSSISEYNRLMT